VCRAADAQDRRLLAVHEAFAAMLTRA
jgi:hypothetical protein